MKENQNTDSNQPMGISLYDVKVVITMILFVFGYLPGLIMMFLWNIGPRWLRISLLLPVILTIFFVLVLIREFSLGHMS